ncbi:phosphate:Na+ symporter [Ekhidna lutea]|uniref:Phosphate:Na+ symporter n=1 Tax=Ekhidna lutea TaxID=447679 RepID=A0A239KND6_EKHLU|nr:Na/Pi cotransporter family protein [Ekhidna lutea]SNT19575.1 phosphate:Na+ symporter [Ekhidna lutea]
MQYGLLEFLNLIGALGFFIYGMKVMSEGIQKVAGAKMRNILSSMTSNRFKGVFTGFTITSLVQSSSATTVLVVSFVNAGLLSLTESIGVIMGANIGTTITAWLISIVGFKVKIASYALPIIAIGFPLMFFNRERLKFWGEVLVGFALLFMGLALLKDSVPDLKANPEILEFLSRYTDLGYLSILLFVLIGTGLTVVVQSSSAAMALTLVMANNGWIPFELAAAMVLGENIGTTITANLAALVGNVHAKRAALSHLIFNLFGVLWILILIRPALSLVDWYLVSSGSESPFVTATSIPIALSIFHSTFNILNTLFLIWFVNFIANTVIKAIKSTGEDEFSLEYISTGMMNTAELSIEEARKETVRLGEMTQKMSKQFQNLIVEDKPKKQKKLLKKIRDYEIMTDRMEQEITEYLMKVTSSGTLSDTSSIKVTSLLSAVNDLERIGDIFFQMSRDVERILKSEKKFKGKQVTSLQEMMDLIDQALTIMVEHLDSTSKTSSLEPAMIVENKIDSLRNALRKDLTKDIKKDKFDPQRDGWYKDLFHLCEKVGDHAINVSEAMTGEKERVLKEELEVE